MCTRSAASTLAAVALAAFVAGCVAGTAASRIPVGWLPRSGAAPPGSDGYGAWVSVKSTGLPGSGLSEGELIACDRDSLWVLTAEGLVGTPLRRVRGISLFKAVRADGGTDEEYTKYARAADLREWARFPQGIPPGLDRTRIRPKVITWR